MFKKPKLILTLGIPASGKTTWAKQLVDECPDFIRIDSDEMRLMLKNSMLFDKHFELFYWNVQHNCILYAFHFNYNVIISDAFCNLQTLKGYFEEYRDKAEVIIVPFTTDVKTCIERDSKRPIVIGEEQIRFQYERFKEIVESGILQEIEDYYKIENPHCKIIE